MPPRSGPAPADPPPSGTGLAGDGPEAVRQRVEASWDAFLGIAESADLAAPSRLPGWRGHDVLVHLGAWGDQGVSHVIAAARGDHPPRRTPRNVDTDNARIVAAHRDTGRAEVLAALRRNRDQLVTWLGTAEARELGPRTVMSPIGPLPLLTALNATSYELAVHALDLEPCAARAPGAGLLLDGLGAVLDVTGHLAYRKALHIDVTAASPDGGWTVRADGGGWTVDPATGLNGTGVRADLRDLVDATAGRQSVPVLLATRRMTAHDLPGFLRLAALVEDVPGLPGGAALRAASKTLGTVRDLGGMLGRGWSRLTNPRD